MPNIESSIITNILLPIALGIIMFGLGLSLTVADFKRVLRYPKAVLVGLFIQMFVLTGICFGICIALKLPPALTLPLIVGFSLQYFMGNEHAVPLPFKKVLQMGVIILSPVIIGMLIRANAANFAAIYSLIMFLTAALFAGWLNRNSVLKP